MARAAWQSPASSTRALDLFALTDFLTREPDRALLPAMVDALRRRLAPA